MAGKADIVDHLANTVEGITKKQAGESFDAVFDYISDTLADGDKIQVPGFGTFQVSQSKERQGHNPKTGEAMTIPASNKVRFKAGKNLKESVNE